MAIYHLHTNTHSRGKGHSAVSAAAYRSGEKLYDERLGQTYNWKAYRKSHGDVLESAIFLPQGANKKYEDRATLWNGAEASEKTKGGEYKKTAAIAREIECSLPVEMSDKQREELAKRHAQFLVSRYAAELDIIREKEAKQRIEEERKEHLYGAHNRAIEERRQYAHAQANKLRRQEPEKAKTVKPEFEKVSPSNDNKEQKKDIDIDIDQSYGGFER